MKPRMLEPSNPAPSSKTPSLSSSTGMEKCCIMPGKSVNFRSTICTPFARQNCTPSGGEVPSNAVVLLFHFAFAIRVPSSSLGESLLNWICVSGCRPADRAAVGHAVPAQEPRLPGRSEDSHQLPRCDYSNELPYRVKKTVSIEFRKNCRKNVYIC